MTELERLLIERRCLRLVTEYCHLVDHGQASRITDLFTDDGVWRYGDFVAVGRAGIGGFFAAREAQSERMSRHVCHNSLIDVTDPNSAAAVTYLTLYRHDGEPGRATSPTQAPEMVGEYRDAFTRTPTGWKFKTRELVVSFIRTAGETHGR